MRSLTINEMNTVSGGAGEVLLGTILVIGVTSALYWATSSSSQCKTYYEQVVSYYDVTTPVYDAYGIYQGDRIDTYPDTKYVPVTICK